MTEETHATLGSYADALTHLGQGWGEGVLDATFLSASLLIEAALPATICLAAFLPSCLPGWPPSSVSTAAWRLSLSLSLNKNAKVIEAKVACNLQLATPLTCCKRQLGTGRKRKSRVARPCTAARVAPVAQVGNEQRSLRTRLGSA